MSYKEFKSSVDKTNKLLEQIEKELGWDERREQSYSALRNVIHALRDRLTVNTAANFAAQLPLLLKGIFWDGWDSEIVPLKMDKQEFIEKVHDGFNYSVEGGIENIIKVVLEKVFEEIEKGEVEDVIATMPNDLKKMIQKSIS